VKSKGGDPHLEIMVPLIGSIEEMRNQSAIVKEMPRKSSRRGRDCRLHVGTMIELPRAPSRDQIAERLSSFSFGTNDLTQTTFGISRDDINTSCPPT